MRETIFLQQALQANLQLLIMRIMGRPCRYRSTVQGGYISSINMSVCPACIRAPLGLRIWLIVPPQGA